jgi:hypothetical protein
MNHWRASLSLAASASELRSVFEIVNRNECWLLPRRAKNHRRSKPGHRKVRGIYGGAKIGHD